MGDPTGIEFALEGNAWQCFLKPGNKNAGMFNFKKRYNCCTRKSIFDLETDRFWLIVVLTAPRGV